MHLSREHISVNSHTTLVDFPAHVAEVDLHRALDPPLIAFLNKQLDDEKLVQRLEFSVKNQLLVPLAVLGIFHHSRSSLLEILWKKFQSFSVKPFRASGNVGDENSPDLNQTRLEGCNLASPQSYRRKRSPSIWHFADPSFCRVEEANFFGKQTKSTQVC